MLREVNRDLIQMVSLMAVDAAMNSDSTIDSTTQLLRCQLQVGIKLLLFISVRQREFVRVLTLLVYLLIHNLLGLFT